MSEEQQPNKTMNEEQPNRLQLAAHAMTGLLASQNPEKGWNLDTLAILSLKIADNLIHFNFMEKLPELISAAPKKEDE